MKSIRAWMLVAALLACFLTMGETRAFQDEQEQDPYRMLQQLERFYSQAGRPRLGRRGDIGADPGLMRDTLQLLQLHTIQDRYKSHPRVDRRDTPQEERGGDSFEGAVRLLQLQTIDRYTSVHRRPRYGKRSENFAALFPRAYANEDDKPSDGSEWLLLQRR